MKIISTEYFDDLSSSRLNLRKTALPVEPKAALVFCGEESDRSLPDWEEFFSELTFPIFGGLFPKVIFKDKLYSKGAVVVWLSEVPHFSVLDLASSNTEYVTPSAERLFENHQSIMIIADGLNSNLAQFIVQVYDSINTDRNVFGGCSGRLTFERKPSIFADSQFLADSALIFGFDSKVSVGLQHGWEVKNGPYSITHSEKNIIYEIDYRPALEVYQEAIGKEAEGLNSKNFSEISYAYPFGLIRLDDTFLVRDPIICQNGGLVCVGEVPVNSVVYVLNGTTENLLSASEKATKQICRGQSFKQVLVINCISRALFLKENSHIELEKISTALGSCTRQLLGFYSLGEIASRGNIALEFHNKTTLVVGIEES